jgi:Family of unknown function (DUF6326)
MKTTKKTTELEDMKINVKIKLSALWAAAMCCYIYGDILSFYKPGVITEIMAGNIGPFPVTQLSLLSAALYIAIPGVMVFLSLALKPKVNRWANIILGVVYIVTNSVSFLTESWAYFIVLGVIEVALTALIVWYAWRWPQQEDLSPC